jgi:hypothetical protein
VIPIGATVAGGQFADLGMDGRPGLVMIGSDAEAPTVALVNVSANPDFPLPFVTTSEAIGLGNASDAKTIAAADFDGDGDIDLVLGLQDLVGRVKRAKRPQGAEGPQNNWVGIKLNGQAEDNPWGIGATISLVDAVGNPLGSQVVTSGGGRGGQPDPVRIFGLGNHVGSVKAIVHWPLGFVDEFTVTTGVVNTLQQMIGCNFVGNSVDLTINYEPDGSLEWVFTWETDRWTKTSEDRVTIEKVSGSTCAFSGTVTLMAGEDPDIEVKPVTMASTGVYRHELRWKNQTCYPKCRYEYTVRSWNGVNPEAEVISAESEIRFPVCPAMQ